MVPKVLGKLSSRKTRSTGPLQSSRKGQNGISATLPGSRTSPKQPVSLSNKPKTASQALEQAQNSQSGSRTGQNSVSTPLLSSREGQNNSSDRQNSSSDRERSLGQPNFRPCILDFPIVKTNSNVARVRRAVLFRQINST